MTKSDSTTDTPKLGDMTITGIPTENNQPKTTDQTKSTVEQDDKTEGPLADDPTYNQPVSSSESEKKKPVNIHSKL